MEISRRGALQGAAAVALSWWLPRRRRRDVLIRPATVNGSVTIVAPSHQDVTVKPPTDFMVVVGDMQPGAGANPPPTVVAAKVVADNPDLIIMPGDLANDGTTVQYGYFNTMYGALKSRIYPAPGNHDYGAVPPTGDLTNYDTYWGAQAHSPQHYYSFDTPNAGWHIISIDSNTQWSPPGSISSGTATYNWVVSDLASNTGKPILAYWHHPRWSEGNNATDPGGTGDLTAAKDIYELLIDNKADLVCVGHCHSMQRFPKFGKTAAASASGIRQFVVGSGGSGLHTLNAAGRRTEYDSYQSAAYDQLNSQFFGYLRLYLTRYSYSWQFVSQTGSVLDSGGPVVTNK